MAIVTLTTDFSGHYTGIMAGVVKGIAPSAEVFTITDQVEPFDIKGGAFVLLSSYKHFPRGTVHAAVVDPGVGTDRRAVAIRTRGYWFVGPDNGILSPAAEEDGIIEAFELPRQGANVSRTFEGRDVFAPAAGTIAAGAAPAPGWRSAGGIQRLEFWKSVGCEFVRCEVVFVDRFGNLTLSLREGDTELEGELLVQVGGRSFRARRAGTYSEIGDGLGVVLGSEGFYELAVRGGSAKELTGAASGSPISLARG